MHQQLFEKAEIAHSTLIFKTVM